VPTLSRAACAFPVLQLDLLKAHRPALQQQALSEQVTCLKAYISSVADAELDGDDELLAITAAHTSSYAVQLIKAAADPAALPCKVSCLDRTHCRGMRRHCVVQYSRASVLMLESVCFAAR
jgi:hypothetical protein